MKIVLAAALLLALPCFVGCQSHMHCARCGQSQTGLFTTDKCQKYYPHAYIVDQDYALEKQVELQKLALEKAKLQPQPSDKK